MKHLLMICFVACPLLYSGIPEQAYRNGFFIDDYTIWARNEKEFKGIQIIINTSWYSQFIMNNALSYGNNNSKGETLGHFLFPMSSIARSSDHLANAYCYAVRDDNKNAMYHAGMGIGLAINGAILAGGANQLQSSVLKNTLYGISGTAALLEAKNQFQKGQEYWDKDRWRAGAHFCSASIFTVMAGLPFILDYRKKS